MNIEKQIQNLIYDEYNAIDADKFLDRLHRKREQKIRKQQRISYGISLISVILLVGILAITQIRNNSSDLQYNQNATAEYGEIEPTDEYYDELMVYLVDQSDDIWSTMEFLYEINN